MHGAGLSVGISCQKSTMKPRAGSYITNKKKKQKTTVLEKKLKWRMNFSNPVFFFFFVHRWHQQLLVILCFLKDVQLLIWRKKSICGNVCESIQVRGYTLRTADVRDGGCLLEPFHKCFWAFLLCVPQLCTYCGSSRSSQREWYVWADGVRQHTCSPHFHWLIASSRCRCNSWLVSEILQTLKFGGMIQIHGSRSSSDNQLPWLRSEGWNVFFFFFFRESEHALWAQKEPVPTKTYIMMQMLYKWCTPLGAFHTFPCRMSLRGDHKSPKQ